MKQVKTIKRMRTELRKELKEEWKAKIRKEDYEYEKRAGRA